MLTWTFYFLLAAIVAGILGFGGVATSFGNFAEILFFAFITLFVVSALGQLLSRQKPTRN